MEVNWNNRIFKRNICSLTADCMLLNGRSDLNPIKVVNYSEGGIGLISNKLLKIGSQQVIVVNGKCNEDNFHECLSIRMVSVAEVIWVQKIFGNKSTAFNTGVKYSFIP